MNKFVCVMLCQFVSSCIKLCQVASGCVKLFQYVSSDAKVFHVFSSCVKFCYVLCHLSYVIRQILFSDVICHMSFIICRLSNVVCQMLHQVASSCFNMCQVMPRFFKLCQGFSSCAKVFQVCQM